VVLSLAERIFYLINPTANFVISVETEDEHRRRKETC
jgi:hypothetical protein